MDELIVVPDPGAHESQKGEVFEELIKHVLKTQRYKVWQRVNFTAMEVDLIAHHLDRENETAYVECKARKSLSATDVKNFCFEVDFKEASVGIFVSTIPFEHQVAGLIKEARFKERYPNIYFWGPDKIEDLLIDAGIITRASDVVGDFLVSKKILVHTHCGTFWVLMLAKGSRPSHFAVLDAKTGQSTTNDMYVELVRQRVEDTELAEWYRPSGGGALATVTIQAEDSETVAEVQESEKWFDLLPASSSWFVGRNDLRGLMLDLIRKVSRGDSLRRIFYLDGNSGWGKSSLIADLRGRSRGTKNRNRFFVLAVDTRSASSGNFVSLAFTTLLEQAMKAGFMPTAPMPIIRSSVDVLGSEPVRELLQKLHERRKVLVIVFDQFEDVFRKPGLFKAFYKFLMDVSALKSSLVVGFSWKSEINIPIGHEAYYLWQQAREYAMPLSVREFNSAEISGIIGQLERALGSGLDPELRRKIVWGSQGFPWLVKKLCVHIFKQLQNSETMESLVEKELNCEALFTEDEAGLTAEELKALRHVAQRSYDGDFLDAVEVDELVRNDVLQALLHKRLIIKSGTKYNVYWDIFRDYLVTNSVPRIGDSYLIRQYPHACIDLFRNLEGPQTVSQLMAKYPVKEGTLLNRLRELRNLSLVEKKGDFFRPSAFAANLEIRELREFIGKRLSRHTLYHRLTESGATVLTPDAVMSIFKGVFKGESFEESTWTLYANFFYRWCSYAGVQLPTRVSSPKGFAGFSEPDNRKTFTPQSRPAHAISVLMSLQRRNLFQEVPSYLSKALYDLKSLGFVNYAKQRVILTRLGEEAKQQSEQELAAMVAARALETEKIRAVAQYMRGKDVRSWADLTELMDDLFPSGTSRTYRKQTTSVLGQWGRLVLDVLGASALDHLAIGLDSTSTDEM